MLPKLEFNSANLVYIPEKDPFALKPIPDSLHKLVELDLNWPPPEDAHINFPLSADAEFEMEVEMPVNKLLAAEFGKNCDWSYSIQLSEPYQEQIRKHKKKRINKKWGKRYGFRTKYKNFKFTEVSIVPKGTGVCEFTTNLIPTIVKGER